MWDSFKDPSWLANIVTIVGIIAIPVAIVAIVRTRKSLAYVMEAFVPIFSVKDELEGKLKVTYEDTPVRRLHRCIVKVVNNGWIPILKSDFEDGVYFDFGEGARVISAAVSDLEPKDLRASVSPYGNDQRTVRFEPLLMNRKDYVRISVLVSGSTGLKGVSGRIVGVSKVKLIDPPKSMDDYMGRLFMWLLLCGTLIWAFKKVTGLLTEEEHSQVIIALVVLCFLLTVVEGSRRGIRMLRERRL